MNILIADKFEKSGVEGLKALGCRVVNEPTVTEEALPELLVRSEADILVVRGRKVTAPMLTASASLGLVVRAGAGYNTIDVKTASQRSILVANCPGKNAIAVAELTFGLMLALDRRIVDAAADLRAGRWNKKEYSQARGLKGRTLGIIGMGEIGKAVARRAQAFRMKIVAWSRSLTPELAEECGVIACASPAEVAAQCDVLTIHLAAAPATKGLINADILGRLAPGSYVINTARADVMDYAAVSKAMAEKNLRVGLDVFPDEPAVGQAEYHAEILKAGGVVYGTHHIGASTDEAQEAIAAEVVRVVRVYAETGRVENCVNLCAKSPARNVVVVRHRNRPGVLAHALNAISRAGVNVEEMENIICEGAESACAKIKLDAPLDENTLGTIRTGNEHVFAVTQSALS
jgi:D-3-phosphoglycerate dehydrogenase